MSDSHFRGTRRELYEIGRERRGRPRSNKVKLFFKLGATQTTALESLQAHHPLLRATQSELVGLGIEMLGRRLDRIAEQLGHQDIVLPTGIVDLEALYLFWNLDYPREVQPRSTTVYLTPSQAVRLGEIRARLRLQIRVTQSELLNLGLALLMGLAIDGALAAEPLPMRTVDDLSDLLRFFV